MVVTLLLASCGRPEQTPLLFEAAPWMSGEQHTMSLTNADGQQVGSAVYTLNSTKNSTGEPAWTFERQITALGSQEVITVTMDTQGFRPRLRACGDRTTTARRAWKRSTAAARWICC